MTSRRPSGDRRRTRYPSALLAVVLALGVSAGLSTPAAAAGDDITITGRGYGHGRGMGQYGALGYAVDRGWDAGVILSHYYGGSHLTNDAGNPTIDVELVARTGADTAATGTNLTVNGVAVGSSTVRLVPVGNGTFTAQVTSGVCGQGGTGWTSWGGVFPSGSVISSSGSATTTLCDSTAMRTYRGALVAVWAGGKSYTFNRTAVDDYLRGVVPRESPSSWGDLPNGMEALEAQAVAARSYALSSGRTSGAKTCDTESCQVYGGYSQQAYGSSSVVALETTNGTRAVVGTAGHVMRLNSTNAIARTEFSSSTGGWTAGGTFSAVEDLGDSTSRNPNRTWSATFSRATVAAKLGTGPISSFTVTARNGLGADGGRVVSATVVSTSGARSTFTGDQVRTALGLKSNWFVISATSTVPTAEASKVVTALYADILGRQPDSGGLAAWTNLVVSDGHAGRAANGISASSERLGGFVAAEYRNALRREPEPAGLAFWTWFLQSGRTVPELQAYIYASDESISTLGQGDLGLWIDGVYQGILGRQAAAEERAAWVSFARNVGPAEAVKAIARSDEAGLIRLSRYYRQMLGREPDPTGIAGFLPMMAGNGDMVLPGYLGQSAEYWTRAQSR